MSKSRSTIVLALGLALAALAPRAAAAAARFEGQGTASLSGGFDSNPSRTVGDTSDSDGYVSLAATGRGRLALGDGHLLSGRYDLGLRKYASELGEDVAVQQGELEYAERLGRFTAAANLAGKLRLSRSGDRDYADGTASLWGDWRVSDALALRLVGGFRAFRYPPDPERSYDSRGPQLGFTARYQLSRRLSFDGGLQGAWPLYHGAATLPSSAAPPEAGASASQRRDRQLIAQGSAAYRGPVAAQLGYAFVRNASNSYGESTHRHRLTAAVTAPLGETLFAMVQAAYQFIRYDDGIVLSQTELLLEDEAQSSVEAKLAWPVSDALDLEIRYAIYWIDFPPSGPGQPATAFHRQVAGAGAVARF